MRTFFLFACLLFSVNVLAQNDRSGDTTVGKMAMPGGEVYTYAEQMPEPGYDIAKYLSENLQYPDSAFKYNVQGRVVLKFIVNEDGSITDCKVEKGIGAGCDEEAVRVVSLMPKWKAGVKAGQPVRVLTMLPVSFILTTPQEKQVYEHIDQMPIESYDANRYFSENIRYPDSARENNIQGRVIVRFIITETGAVDSVKVLKSIGWGCDEEAVRVIKNMPHWKPGMQNGKPVKVYFTQPITFSIEDDRYPSRKKKDRPADYIYDLRKDHPDKWPNANYDYAKYISEHVQYPVLAREHNIEGDVIVKFVVNKDSTINDCQIVSYLGGGCDTEAIRVIKSMPKWSPGIYDRKPINAEQLVTVSFYPSEEERRLVESKKIYTYVEQMPASGYDCKEYIAKHIHYPDSANSENITGRVIIKFLVTEAGAIDSVSVLRGIGGGCDEEAVRLVKNMPPWKPGKQNGKPVKVWFNMPVSFSKN